ncbi:DNase1 protein [Biscogniauxia mediterranea]|nr:DNase1 protein [Biscogniauxia mediterranea]
MHFLAQLAALAAAAATVSANTMTFVNQDDTPRHIVFTPSEGHEAVGSVDVSGHNQVTVNIPASWIGNAYSVSQGAQDTVGMLAEVTFQGWNDLTYFDVSAIVNPNDHVGVKQMFPATQMEAAPKSSVSGCEVFPCDTAYYHPEDVQTVTTKETDIIITLGTPSNVASRDVEGQRVPRNYVLGKF